MTRRLSFESSVHVLNPIKVTKLNKSYVPYFFNERYLGITHFRPFSLPVDEIVDQHSVNKQK